MDKTRVIELVSEVIQEASKQGKNYNWVADERNCSLDHLCEELDISLEEIQDNLLKASKTVAERRKPIRMSVIRVKAIEDFYIEDENERPVQGFNKGDTFDVKIDESTGKFVYGEAEVAKYDETGEFQMHEYFELV